MTEKTAEMVEEIILMTVKHKHLNMLPEEVSFLRAAYLKHGDIDLAINDEGDVLSDVKDDEEMDAIHDALETAFGEPERTTHSQVEMLAVNGKLYKTYVDAAGETRFIANPVTQLLYHDMQAHSGLLKKEALDEMFYNGTFTVQEWVDFHAATGCTVAYLKQLPGLENLTVKDPYS
jgi:hypothetical protein